MRHFFGRYGSYYRSILSLGMPIMLGQVGIILTGFCDTLMVGHYSTEALASASFVNNVFTLVTVLCMGFSYGITPIIGALYARGDNAAIGHTMRNAVVLNMAFGAVALVVMAAFYELLDDLGSDLLVLQGGSVNDGLLAVVQEKDGELDLVARLRVELLDVEDVALGNLILLATSCDDCVHV